MVEIDLSGEGRVGSKVNEARVVGAHSGPPVGGWDPDLPQTGVGLPACPVRFCVLWRVGGRRCRCGSR